VADEPGVIQQVLGAVIRIADTLDRLVTILEDLSAVVELPEAAELHREKRASEEE